MILKVSETSRLLSRDAIVVLAILAVTLVPRVAFLSRVGPGEINNDALLYVSCASTIIHHGVFGMAEDLPTLKIPPLYPMFLAILIAVVGIKAAIISQIILACVTSLLAWDVARRRSRVAGLFTGLLFAMYVPAIRFSTKYLTETVGVFAIVFLVWIADRLVRKTGILRAVVTGLVCGLGGLVRAIQLPLLVAPMLLVFLKHGRSRRSLQLCGGLLVGFGIALAPWVTRNAITFGSPHVLPVVGSGVTKKPYLIASRIAQGDSYVEANRKYQHERDAGTLEVPTQIAVSTRVSHFFCRLGIITGTHTGALEVPFPFAGQKMFIPEVVQWANYGISAAIWLGTFIALAVAICKWDLSTLHTIAVPFGLILLYAVVHAIPRYQVVPFAAMTIPAGIGWAWLFGARRSRQVENGDDAT